MLIDLTYFINEITIGNKGDTTIQGIVNSYISKYEPKFIKKVLGNDYDYNTSDPYDIQNDDDFLKALASYVFYWYTRNNYIDAVSIGTTVANAENSQVVRPIQKMTFAWNDMVDYLQFFIDRIDVDSIDNPFEYKNQLEI